MITNKDKLLPEFLKIHGDIDYESHLRSVKGIGKWPHHLSFSQPPAILNSIL